MRLWFMALCGLLLSACASLSMPGSITFSEDELQAQLARRFPDPAQPARQLRSAAGRAAAAPGRAGQAPVHRADACRPATGARGRSLQGRLTLGYALRFEPADGSIRLVQPRVESVRVRRRAGRAAAARRSDAAHRHGAGRAAARRPGAVPRAGRAARHAARHRATAPARCRSRRPVWKSRSSRCRRRAPACGAKRHTACVSSAASSGQPGLPKGDARWTSCCWSRPRSWAWSRG